MRASTMFAMTLALLAGLGAVVAARYAGWLGKPEAAKEKEKEITVLAAGRNLFPGDLIDASYVKTRPLKPEEREAYLKHKDNYLPPVPAAVSLRVASKPIEADALIRRDDLKEFVKPDPLNMRLLPNMRAVNISVQKENSAGGLIQEGEWVDVYLTTTISVGDKETNRTALVATALRVIAKRNALWRVLAPLPDNKPVNFTVEANPYRSALIEFAKSKGHLTLVPLSSAEQKELETKRGKLLNVTKDEDVPVSLAEMTAEELTAEEERVESFARGDVAVGTDDLVRIFGLTTPPPPSEGLVVERFTGLTRGASMRFNPDGQFIGMEETGRTIRSTTPARSSQVDASSFQFSLPGSVTPASKCKNCKKPK